MQLKSVGPLRARTVVKTTGSSPKAGDKGALTIVLMHGYGAPGDDLVGLADAIQAPAGTTLIFPEAPSVLQDPMMPFLGDARAWWSIDVGRYQRAILEGTLEHIVDEEPVGMAKVREAVVEMLDVIERESNTTGDRIVLGGFSQGAMLATDVALHTKRPLAGLVVLSGTLLAAKTWLPRMSDRQGLSVFQSHGTEDPILPYPLATRLRQAFEGAGMGVTFSSFAGGHGIAPSVMRDFAVWLEKTQSHV